MMETVFNTRQKPKKVIEFEVSQVYDGSRTVDRDYVSVALDHFGEVSVFEFRPADAREFHRQLTRVLGWFQGGKDATKKRTANSSVQSVRRTDQPALQSRQMEGDDKTGSGGQGHQVRRRRTGRSKNPGQRGTR